MQQSLSLAWTQRGKYSVTFCSRAMGGGDRPAARELLALLHQRQVLLVTTPTPWRLHGARQLPSLARAAGAHVEVLVLPLSEATKTMESAVGICRRAEAVGLGRADLIVAFGGGLVCDVVTVAASQLHRGMPYACLPTTLVGQVDAGIGLKGAVNLDGAKNRLGCFYPPESVVSDPEWLLSLNQRAMRSGLAEIVKVGVVRDLSLLTTLEEYGYQLLMTRFARPAGQGEMLLGAASRAMLEELALAPFEGGMERRLMDFGHTYSSTLERVSGYTLTHGEAVAIDIALSTEIAVGLGRLDRDSADRVIRLLVRLGLAVSSRWCNSELAEHSHRQARRQRRGRLNLVLPVGPGKGDFVDDVPRDVIVEALRRISALAADQRGQRRRPPGEAGQVRHSAGREFRRAH